MNDWEKISIAPDETHHRVARTPLYSRRFFSVLPFHAPGLAPVVDRTGAYHIDSDGHPAYHHRFSRTFGFYEEKASVYHRETGWFHIFPNGNPVYPERYDWCGNYQNGFATVRNHEREYCHLDANGRCAYAGSWRYAGDFREGSAVVQNAAGLHSHIDAEGVLIHHQWFSDLDVFHKGLARAEDEGGWHHIDQSGNPVYKKRFARIEPFYNGQARVTTFNHALLVIDESGNTLAQLRPAREDGFHALSADLVSYWKSYTIHSAVELGVVNCLPASLENIAANRRLSPTSTKRLLRALQELGLVEFCDQSELFSATEKGRFLKEDVKYSLAAAARTWVETHTSDWKHLTRSLMTEKPSSNREFFERLSQDEGAVRIYQKALASYAEYDYRDIPQRIDWVEHGVLIDAGGGQGTLLKQILSAYPDLKGR